MWELNSEKNLKLAKRDDIIWVFYYVFVWWVYYINFIEKNQKNRKILQILVL